MTILNYEIIRNEKQISRMINNLRKLTEIGIDLESNSMYRFYPKICLMQIATLEKVYLIDIDNLGLPKELRNLLEDNQVTKTFQDLQYDLALLEYQFSVKPRNLYDISIADKLIRQKHNMRSLQRMVKYYLKQDISTSRSVQKSNWCKRPLDDKQIRYAVKDTALILPIKREQEKLISDGVRDLCLAHYLENFNVIDLTKTYNIDSMWKLKGINLLSQQQLHYLQNLLLTRLKIAKRIDRPIHWIARDKSLVKAAKQYPVSINKFKHIIGQDNLTGIQKSTLDQLYLAFESQDFSKKLEPPEEGVSLRRWISNSSNDSSRYLDPQIISELKDWVKLVSQNTKLLPEFVMTNEDIFDQVSSKGENIEFRGVPAKFTQLFKTDYYYFKMTGKSNLHFNDLKSRV